MLMLDRVRLTNPKHAATWPNQVRRHIVLHCICCKSSTWLDSVDYHSTDVEHDGASTLWSKQKSSSTMWEEPEAGSEPEASEEQSQSDRWSLETTHHAKYFNSHKSLCSCSSGRETLSRFSSWWQLPWSHSGGPLVVVSEGQVTGESLGPQSPVHWV